MLIAAIFIILLLAYIALGIYCVNKACKRRGELDLAKPSHIKGTTMEKYEEKIRAGINWIERQNSIPLRITSHDGLRLAARLIEQPSEKARGTIIAVHGYRSKAHSDFSCSAQLYYQMGYHVLLVDQRAHGQSEGKYLGFGVLERYDCIAWINCINARYGKEKPVFLCGMSMGASTVLMASGSGLPNNVRGIIADCGFTSPWDILKKELPHYFRLPVWFLLPLMNVVTHMLAGYGFRDYSTLEAMKVNTRPVLFVHGKADDFVPPWMTQAAYDACTAEKQLLLVEGAGHGMSFLLSETAYCKAMTDFIGKYSAP